MGVVLGACGRSEFSVAGGAAFDLAFSGGRLFVGFEGSGFWSLLCFCDSGHRIDSNQTTF
jgi:hypothetical protein